MFVIHDWLPKCSQVYNNWKHMLVTVDSDSVRVIDRERGYDIDFIDRKVNYNGKTISIDKDQATIFEEDGYKAYTFLDGDVIKVVRLADNKSVVIIKYEEYLIRTGASNYDVFTGVSIGLRYLSKYIMRCLLGEDDTNIHYNDIMFDVFIEGKKQDSIVASKLTSTLAYNAMRPIVLASDKRVISVYKGGILEFPTKINKIVDGKYGVVVKHGNYSITILNDEYVFIKRPNENSVVHDQGLVQSLREYNISSAIDSLRHKHMVGYSLEDKINDIIPDCPQEVLDKFVNSSKSEVEIINFGILIKEAGSFDIKYYKDMEVIHLLDMSKKTLSFKEITQGRFKLSVSGEIAYITDTSTKKRYLQVLTKDVYAITNILDNTLTYSTSDVSEFGTDIRTNLIKIGEI